MCRSRWSAAVLAAVISEFACATSAFADNPAFEIVRDHVDYEVNSDASYTERQEKVFLIRSAEGLDALRQVVLSYTDGYQDAGIERAFTIKRDGTRIDVPQGKMLTGYGLTTSAGFHDQKTKVAVFENAAIGDEVGYVTVFRQKKPWYPGEFFTSFTLGQNVVLHDFQVTVTAPKSLALHVDAPGLTGGELAATDSHQRWLWTFENPTAYPPESEGVSGYDGKAYLVVSTFADFAALARAYEDGAHGKADVTANIRSLAERIGGGAGDRRVLVRRLYDWVSSNIKYEAIVLGNGGLVPHSAEDVLHNGYGDCKDHVTLLQALLAAEGVRSSPALINLGPSYKLPGAASPEAFDHVITFVPEFDLYLDSTATHVPFGELPRDDLDKPVLLTASQSLGHTPTQAVDRTALHTVSHIRIHSDGSAEGTSEFIATGTLAAGLRTQVASIDPGIESQYLRDMVPGTMDGALTISQAENSSDGYSGTASYRIENAANLAGPGAISFALGFQPKPLRNLIDASLPERRQAYVCPSFVDTDETTISFPGDVTIAYVPRQEEVNVEGVNFVVRYERMAGNAVKSTATLRVDHPRMVCTADYYNRTRGAMSRMIGLLGAQIVYTPASTVRGGGGQELAYAPCAAKKCSSQ